MPKDYSEKELVQGCVKNDRYFQEMLYRKYFPVVMRMCRRYTRDEYKAMEIINTGFLRVFKKIHTFEFRGSLEGWIKKLVFHALSDYFRKNTSKFEVVFLENQDNPVRNEALSNMYAEDILRLVDKLSPVTQEVFRLYAIEGFSHKEIAQQIGISVGTSKWHLSNARKKLKALIQKNDGFKLYAG